MKSKITRRMKIIWMMILIGFCAIEFPGILIVGKMARPFIFGLPFLYAYMIFWWLYLCIVIYLAYRENWGRSPR
ncbi:hypothetical protein FRZ06_08140 [Anoxybacterium hadale]|uniref:Uncharacterized protein n=1 Tax=Anoxybacterium hadale TaxID=3408580 RepID=A0ACD1AA29_9FIRM|nr:hypothetical protein FRZ06_08140 [Clostridiales bacterium]